MEIKYKSYRVIGKIFNYIEFVNGIEVNRSIPLYIEGNINPQAFSVVDEINRVREALRTENYHPHMDFYRNLKNPLDSYEVMSILVNCYANGIKDGSMYYTLTHANTGKKQFKGKIVTSSRDIFYARLFNMWKDNLIKLDNMNKFLDAPNYQKLVSHLRDIDDIRTYHEYINILSDAVIAKSIFTSASMFSDWEHISSDNVFVGTTKKLRSIDHRFYINTEGIILYDFLNVFLKKCIDMKLPFYFKFNEDCKRDDSVVIYCDTSHFMKYLNLLEDIKKEYPDIVKYCENPPLLTSIFYDYVGYGSDSSDIKGLSFNELREKVINNAFSLTIDDWIKDNIDKGITIGERQISTIELIAEVCSTQIFGYYKELFERYKMNNHLAWFSEHYGLDEMDFIRPNFRVILYERIKTHVKDIINDPTYIINHPDEMSVEVHNGKFITITENKFENAKRGIVRYIFTDDETLMKTLKDNIGKISKFEGVDISNISFDERIKEKFEMQDKYLRRRRELEKDDQVY